MQDPLLAKRDKLQEQLSEASKLKANIDRRSRAVSAFMAKYLSEEEREDEVTFEDYRAFAADKVALVLRARDLQERIALAEEQHASI